MRKRFFLIDLLVYGWLGLLLILALTGALSGGGEYSAKLLETVVPLLIGYIALHVLAIRVHRKWQAGAKTPAWMSALMMLALFSPMIIMPATFLAIGHAMQANHLVPSIESHPDFDVSANYDPDHSTGSGVDIGPHGAATSWDISFKQADEALFGTYPPEAIRSWHAPWLTGVMQLCYLFYYLAPILAGVPLMFQRRWREFRMAAAVVAFCLLLTYIGYFFFPSTGPRFEGGIEAWLPAESGWFGAEAIYRAIDAAETFRWDAFPSGHVAVSLASLLIALRFNRKLGYAMVLPVLGLCMATIYMGYHYGVDVLGGLGCAAFAMVFAPWATQRWEAKLWDGGVEV